MTKEMVLENLKSFIGEELDVNNIICAFEDFEEDGKSYVYFGESHNNGYDYIAYRNVTESTQFLIDFRKIFDDETGNLEKEIIEDVWIA